MDWNWFFSSTAQSAAAIVAVFSAFIITKIINNQAQFESNKRRINSFLNESKKYMELAKYRRIGWYCQYCVNKETKKIQEKAKVGELPATAEEYYFTSTLPLFIKRDGLIARIAQIMKFKPYSGTNAIEDALIKVKSVADIAEESQIREEQNKIYDLIADIKHHILLLKDLIEELSDNQQSSPVIKWSILVSMSLFYIGVIYPLGFMPLRQDAVISLGISTIPDYIFCFKGALLSVLTIVFTGINLYFLKKNSGMVYGQAVIDELKSYSNFGDYSVYFQNMEDNQKASDKFFKKLEEEKEKLETEQTNQRYTG